MEGKAGEVPAKAGENSTSEGGAGPGRAGSRARLTFCAALCCSTFCSTVMAPAAPAATQAAVCGSSRLRRPWQPRSAELQGAARTAGEYSAPASQARRRWRPACAGTAGWRRGADSEGHGGGPTTSRCPPQRGWCAAAGTMSGRQTLGRGRGQASRAASRARTPSLAARGPLRGRERERRERRAGKALFSSLPDSSSPPLPQPPSPPPPRGSSPADPRPPASLTLYCDPRGGGAGPGRLGAPPPIPAPPRLARAPRSRGGARARPAGLASEPPLRQVARCLPLAL